MDQENTKLNYFLFEDIHLILLMNMLTSGQAQIWGENLRECETFPPKFLLQQ